VESWFGEVIATLGGIGTAAPTRSRLERRFLAALRASTIPEPVKEHPLGRHLADFT
jgi:hypothetical protein